MTAKEKLIDRFKKKPKDFSFDEEEEFEPVEKFSKKSNLKEPKAEPKGYQRIENN